MIMSTASLAASIAPQDSPMVATEQSHASCSQCGSSDLGTTTIRSAFWEGDRLVVIEDIPAIVCGSCGEQHYDDTTVVLIDLLRGDGFPAEKARRQISVPVFSLRDRLKPGQGS
jgi:YgiT-type zinc finger domain-containing protein